MPESKRVFVAGHAGLVGSAIVRRLRRSGESEILTIARSSLDLRDFTAVRKFFENERPDLVYLAAAVVGGIAANANFPAKFIHDNLAIQTSTIHAAFAADVEKLCFFGSSCIYPRLAPQPITEECLLSGPLEPTNSAYAIAKIAGIEMCRAYRRQYGFDAICLMPTNLYGPGDNFDPEFSHVLPALIRRFHEAKLAGSSSVTIWGSGKPRREFLHVDDLADAAVHLMRVYSDEDIVNIGVGEDMSIAELACLVAEIVGFHGEIKTDPSKPDGTPRKLLDISRLAATGWNSQISLREGIGATYEWYLENQGGAAD